MNTQLQHAGGISNIIGAVHAPLFKQHVCMVCEDTGLVATEHQNDAGEYLNGRCWKKCEASDAVVWSHDQEQWIRPADPVRFNLRKCEASTKKPWIVEDTHSNPAEDPVLYSFSSKAKAERFKAEMEAEHGIQLPAGTH
ncbi:hypothetical protein IYR97_23510 (plasmid) [Pseudomonas fulva]|jgi:hypothetical protein|uniref:Uncharacterized protein n=3 Tax=Pseudomonas TaxID=286 RepID=A0A1X0ZWZ0_PSEPU|nr:MULTISPECIES: hypothetical protein [Pseudomonas]MCT8164011.1 hypothetical protein [Pseudomonas sp. HD6422]MCT8183001.1 hypothetical protein [Pseudomonas sp. HD6421]MDH1930467.1 hypothetical protein [Pseudomonas sp. GD03696]MDM1711729.1 hypothetical protein [Pseudomonas sp. 165]ORL48612.1 hypothetical protein B7H18_25980 [Pseudomonas putida]